jgi:hypothetical protein
VWNFVGATTNFGLPSAADLDSTAVAVRVLLVRRGIGSDRRGWWVGGRLLICAAAPAQRSGAMRAGAVASKAAAA